MKIRSIMQTALAVALFSATSAVAQSGTPEAPDVDTPAPESTPAEVDTSTVRTDATKSLVVCGPNGAAYVVENVNPGCHVLRANTPPGQATNAAAE